MQTKVEEVVGALKTKAEAEVIGKEMERKVASRGIKLRLGTLSSRRRLRPLLHLLVRINADGELNAVLPSKLASAKTGTRSLNGKNC